MTNIKVGDYLRITEDITATLKDYTMFRKGVLFKVHIVEYYDSENTELKGYVTKLSNNEFYLVYPTEVKLANPTELELELLLPK